MTGSTPIKTNLTIDAKPLTNEWSGDKTSRVVIQGEEEGGEQEGKGCTADDRCVPEPLQHQPPPPSLPTTLRHPSSSSSSSYPSSLSSSTLRPPLVPPPQPLLFVDLRYASPGIVQLKKEQCPLHSLKSQVGCGPWSLPTGNSLLREPLLISPLHYHPVVLKPRMVPHPPQGFPATLPAAMPGPGHHSKPIFRFPPSLTPFLCFSF